MINPYRKQLKPERRCWVIHTVVLWWGDEGLRLNDDGTMEWIDFRDNFAGERIQAVCTSMAARLLEEGTDQSPHEKRRMKRMHYLDMIQWLALALGLLSIVLNSITLLMRLAH